MIRFVVKRLLQAIPLLFGIVVIVFVLVHLTPSDPIQAIVGNYPVTDELRAKLAELYHLNGTIWEQFVSFLGRAATGDLGYSLVFQEDVVPLILSRLPNTLVLVMSGFAIGAILGAALGMLMALTRHRFLDTSINVAMLSVFALPLFWVGQLLVVVFAVQFGWFPAQGNGPVVSMASGFDAFIQNAPYYVLPILVYVLHEGSRVSRLTRTSVLDVASRPFISTAEMKGLGPFQILRRHVLRNSVLPVLTAVGYNLGIAIAGSVLVETVFSWPGVGRLLISSINAGDNQVVIGITLLIGASVVILNLLVDLAYALLDPRTRLSRGGAR